jgi:hypothetical protein
MNCYSVRRVTSVLQHRTCGTIAKVKRVFEEYIVLHWIAPFLRCSASTTDVGGQAYAFDRPNHSPHGGSSASCDVCCVLCAVSRCSSKTGKGPHIHRAISRSFDISVLWNFRFGAGLDGGFHGPMNLDGVCTSVPEVHSPTSYNRLAEVAKYTGAVCCHHMSLASF